VHQLMPFKQHYLPFFFGIALTGSAVFIYPQRSLVLTALMLFLPLLDRHWQLPRPNISKYRLILLSLCSFSILILMGLNTDYTTIALTTLLTAALPEEWFFRGYFMMRIENMGLRAYQANIITSLLFALLHLPTQGVFGLSIFVPSMIYGWIFQKSKDIVLVILLHALSNIVFFSYIKTYLNR